MAAKRRKTLNENGLRKGDRINDEQFWAFLTANAGIFGRTARAISAHLGAPYHRESVATRAKRQPKRLAAIREANIDVAEENLFSLMRSKDERIKYKATEFFLKTIGRDRGYVQQHDHRVAIGVINVGFEQPGDESESES